MFKITPIQEKSKQKDIAELCGAKFNDEYLAYQMFDMETGEIMGMSQFEIGEAGYIHDLREANGRNDFEAMFILGRQTMNFIDSCGVHTCHANPNAGDIRLLTAIGFKGTENDLSCDMTDMFNGNCGNH